MAIKLNGVEITSNKLNNSDVTLENLDGVKVWPTAVIGNEWVYLFMSTSTSEVITGETGTRISITGHFGGNPNLMQSEITGDFPPDNYNVGQVMLIEDYDDGYFYYFQVGQK